MSHQTNRTPDVRSIDELDDMASTQWSSDELHHYQRTMSDFSPWLNAQGTALLAGIIQEIERREERSETESVDTI